MATLLDLRRLVAPLATAHRYEAQLSPLPKIPTLLQADTKHDRLDCFQVDPLTDFMTGIETLLFYGSLKGLPKDQIPHAAQSLIQRVSCLPF